MCGLCVLFFSLVLLHLCYSETVVLALNDNLTTIEIDCLYSTLGPFIHTLPPQYPVTIVHPSDVTCSINLPSSSISGHFLIYIGAPVDEFSKFQDCTNYFFDNYGHPLYLTHLAQKAGAVGVLAQTTTAEVTFTNGRSTGISDKITIPYLVMSSEAQRYLANNADSVEFIQLPTISAQDQAFISRFKTSFRAMNIACCILYPLLATLTLYFAIVDILHYRALPTDKRTIHPILTKIAPFISAVVVSIWQIVDPFSHTLIPKFPATFFERWYFGFLEITCCLLLKTWILAVGNRLKSPRVYKWSMYIVTTFTASIVVETVIWIGVGNSVQILAEVWGVLTVIICGIGYIYYGKDIIITLSKGDFNSTYSNITKRLIFFNVFFVVVVYTFVFVYIANVLGSILSELLLQTALGIAFIIMYIVLFARKLRIFSASSTEMEETLPGQTKTTGVSSGPIQDSSINSTEIF